MSDYIVLMAGLVCLSAILALALNFQWGLGGLVNFGLAGLFGLAAYCSGLVQVRLGWGWFPATVVAMLVLAGINALVALVTLRVAEEDYFAIVTLGVGEILRLIMLNEEWLTGGARGLNGIPQPFAAVAGVSGTLYVQLIFWIVVTAAVIAFLNAVARAPFGRLMRALRDDEVVVATLGKNVLWSRLKICAVSGTLIGLAGSLHASYYQYIDPSQFSVIVIAYTLMAVIAGGRGAHVGTLLGAVFVIVLIEGSRAISLIAPGVNAEQLASIRFIVVGVALIALLISRPQGFLKEYRLRIPTGPAAPVGELRVVSAPGGLVSDGAARAE